jgi:hypothetical protein
VQQQFFLQRIQILSQQITMNTVTCDYYDLD